MSVSSTTSRNTYTGNDTTLTYSYTFRIPLDTDIKVIVKNTTTSAEYTLTKTTDYAVTGVGASGGTIVLATGGSQAWISASYKLDTGFELTLRRVVGLTQITDIRNQGDFYPESHEDEFDKSRMIDQQQQDDIDRSLKISDSVDPSTFDATIPSPIADQYIKINVAGDGWEYSEGSATNLTDSNIAVGADIQRTKLADGTADHVVTNNPSGVMSSEAELAKVRGGTGADNSSVTFPTTGVIVTEGATQTLTDKTMTAPVLNTVDINAGTINDVDIDGGTATDAKRITLPGETKTNLDGLTRKAGTIVYASDETKAYLDDGVDLIGLGGGSGGLEVFISEDFSSNTKSLFSVTGNSLTPNNAGTGTMAGSLLNDTASPIAGARAVTFLSSGAGSNDFFLSDEIALNDTQNGRDVGVVLFYAYGTASGADGDMKFVVLDATNDTVISSDLDLLEATSGVTITKRFSTSVFVPKSCTSIRYGFQRIAGSSKILEFSNVEFSTNPFVYKNLIEQGTYRVRAHAGYGSTNTQIPYFSTELENSISGFGTLVNDSTSGWSFTATKRCDIVINWFGQGASGDQIGLSLNSSQLTTAFPSITPADMGAYTRVSAGAYGFNPTFSGVLEVGDVIRPHGQGSAMGDNAVCGISMSATASSEHVVTPAKSNMTDWTAYTPTFTGFGTATAIDFGYRRVGEQLHIEGVFTSGTITSEEYKIGLPTGLTIDSNFSEGIPFGKFVFNSASGATEFLLSSTAGDGFINIYEHPEATAYGIINTSTRMPTSGSVHKLTAIVPIEEWTSDATFLTAIPVQKVAFIKDVKASGTAGGTFTSGAWRIRDLNTIEGASEIVSTSFNQFTLQVGVYLIDALAPVRGATNAVKSRLYNITDSSTDIIGTSIHIGGADDYVLCPISGEIEITSPKTFEIQQYCQTTKATDGFGNHTSSAGGLSEVYTQVKITKLR